MKERAGAAQEDISAARRAKRDGECPQRAQHLTCPAVKSRTTSGFERLAPAS